MVNSGIIQYLLGAGSPISLIPSPQLQKPAPAIHINEECKRNLIQFQAIANIQEMRELLDAEISENHREMPIQPTFHLASNQF